MASEPDEKPTGPNTDGKVIEEGQQIDFVTLGMFIIGMSSCCLSGLWHVSSADGIA